MLDAALAEAKGGTTRGFTSGRTKTTSAHTACTGAVASCLLDEPRTVRATGREEFDAGASVSRWKPLPAPLLSFGGLACERDELPDRSGVASTCSLALGAWWRWPGIVQQMRIEKANQDELWNWRQRRQPAPIRSTRRQPSALWPRP